VEVGRPVRVEVGRTFVEVQQMAMVEKSEMRRVGPTPISPFGAGQGEHISVCELKQDDRPTSNFTLWRGAV
jgi:hypothetical protein